MLLSIIIVSYNHKDSLRRTVKSIFAQKVNFDFEVIVVDNASKDSNVEMLRNDFPLVKVIENNKNLGFASANNQAIKISKGELILLLNPDIEIIEGSLSKLVDFISNNPEVSAAGGKLLNLDNSLQMSCRRFPNLFMLLSRRTPLGKTNTGKKLLNRYMFSNWNHDSVRVVDWVIGACLIVRSSVFKTIGLLDDRFFMYFEDTDFCSRLKQCGMKTYYFPGAIFLHSHRRESAKGLLNKNLFYHVTSMAIYYLKQMNTCIFTKKVRRLNA